MILIAVGLLAGCSDREAAKRHEALVGLENAIALARTADRGFVPFDQADGEPPISLQAYRNDRNGKVTQALEVLSRDAPADQRASVKRLLSGYHSSDARYQTRDAANHWTDLAGRISHLLGRMMTIDRIDHRASILETDETPMLEEVGSELEARRSKQGSLEKKVAQHEASIAELNQQIDDLDRQKQLILLEAAGLRRHAFVEKGQQNLEMQRQAAAVQSEAMKLEKQMQELILDRDGVQDKYRIDREQLALYADSTQWLEEVIEQSRAIQATTQDARQEALDAKANQSELMYQRFEKIHASFNEQVDRQLTEAAEEAAKAASVLGGARGSDLERLAAQMTHLYVITQHIMVCRTYGRSLDLLAARADRLVPQRAGSFRATAQDIHKKRDELVAKADQIDADATELVDGLSDEGMSSQYQRYLTNYRQRVHGEPEPSN